MQPIASRQAYVARINRVCDHIDSHLDSTLEVGFASAKVFARTGAFNCWLCLPVKAL